MSRVLTVPVQRLACNSAGILVNHAPEVETIGKLDCGERRHLSNLNDLCNVPNRSLKGFPSIRISLRRADIGSQKEGVL
ncbi:hypothetical protein COMA2_80011 [Candidatus Nitrospira nitrificans]|uniref:Uncharacterized protein n=1 Tax=Candidatus Nitrospira nitrificans TaxID=1742973 RepID=A0A0S4LUD5_9BACT|nr:hypothetical protein COMA2_80011 [Candidatus Nitrospira nitrificans]